jgi:MFS family permease
MIDEMSRDGGERSYRYVGWRVVFVCFLVTLFAWGFAFYGHGVYLAEFSRNYGWSTAAISGASTLTYLISACLFLFVSPAIDRLGVRSFLVLAIVCLAASALLVAAARELWQLVVAYVLMAFGWAGMSVAAVPTILGKWFEERRGLAISLALNGASASGVVFIPPFVALAGAYGISNAIVAAVAIMLLVLLPLVLLLVPPERRREACKGTGAASVALGAGNRQLLASAPFWSVTGPFTLALTAQAGFLVHQLAYLTPVIGREEAALAVAVTTGFAVIGRLGLGFVVDRLNQRMASAASLVSQAAALAVMAMSDSAFFLLPACAVYGFSVGNVITLPALIIQREFDAALFGRVVGLSSAVGQFIYAFGPGLLGVIRDASGGYGTALIFCAICNLIAAATVVRRFARR